MENDVQHLLDLLYDMIDNAKSMPLGNDKCIIERDRALDYLDEIRAQLPSELEESRKLLAARNDYIAAAKKEVENMKQRAESSAKQIVAESETLAAARQQGREIVEKAEKRANELYRVSNEYTDDTLKRAEEALQQALEELKQSHAGFVAASREKLQEARRETSGDNN